jgi:hypothetical protein
LFAGINEKNSDFGGYLDKKGVIFLTEIYRDHVNMFLSKLGYSELIRRLFEKIAFFLVDPLLLFSSRITLNV